MPQKLSAAGTRSANATGGGPSNVPDLFDMDQQILNIMANNYGLPETSALTDPFHDVIVVRIMLILVAIIFCNLNV
jgi:hypothetical protein